MRKFIIKTLFALLRFVSGYKDGKWIHYAGVVKRDKSNRLRYCIYRGGETVKEEETLDFWYFKSNKSKTTKEYLQEMGKIK